MVTAKECLEELRNMRIRIRKLERDIKELHAKLYSLKAIDYSKERISGGEPGDLSDQICRYNEKLEQSRKEWKRLDAFADAVDSLIGKIKSEQLRALLHERYVNGGSWEQVALVVGVSRQWVHNRLYPKALKEFEKIYKNSLQEFTTVYTQHVI
jgi:hypothetical protein